MSSIIISVAVLLTIVITASGVEEMKTETNSTYLAGSTDDFDANNEDCVDVDPDDWLNEYYLGIKMQYQKSENELTNSLIDELYATIDEFYEKIKHGVTIDEYDYYDSTIYSIKRQIDMIYNTNENDEDNVNANSIKLYNGSNTVNDCLEIKEKLDSMYDELNQYIVIHETSNKSLSGVSDRAKVKLEKANSLKDKLDDFYDKIEKNSITVDDAEDLLNDCEQEFYDVLHFDGIG